MGSKNIQSGTARLADHHPAQRPGAASVLEGKRRTRPATEEVLLGQGDRVTKKVATWVWDKFLIFIALCVLFVAVLFSAIEVSMGWVARKLFELTERIK